MPCVLERATILTTILKNEHCAPFVISTYSCPQTNAASLFTCRQKPAANGRGPTRANVQEALGAQRNDKSTSNSWNATHMVTAGVALAPDDAASG